MTIEQLNQTLQKLKGVHTKKFIKEFYNGEGFNLPDGCLIVDGEPKTKYSGIDCMQAVATPAYIAGFDQGVNCLIKLLQEVDEELITD